MSSQRVSITSSSLQSLNNHSLFRGNSRITSMSSRFRNGRSQSPVPNRGGSGGGISQRGRSPTPSRDNLEQDQMIVDIVSQPLSTGELAFFDTLATNAHLDTAHREYAQLLAEVSYLII